MGLCQHTLAAWNPLFSNCFEVRVVIPTHISDVNADLGFYFQIAMAFLISFFAKALSATGYFCYASLSGSTTLSEIIERITLLTLICPPVAASAGIGAPSPLHVCRSTY